MDPPLYRQVRAQAGAKQPELTCCRGFSYYKTPEMEEMDENWGDLYYTIQGEHINPQLFSSSVITYFKEREIELIHQLSQEVLQFEDSLAEMSDICAELDLYVEISFLAARGPNTLLVTRR
jgi:hypothetical protein